MLLTTQICFLKHLRYLIQANFFTIVEVQSFGDGKGLTIRMSERVIIRKEFFNITLEERDVSYKVIIQDIREQYD